MKKSHFLIPALALGSAFILLAPGQQSYGFSKIGGSLPADSQRDFRVFNNFADTQSNNNQTPDPSFPGWQGADMALWKAATEWGSVLHGGTGAGDPTQTLGSGGGNFDFFFGGAATSVGGTNRNIVSATSCGGGGTFAFVESPIGDGWRMLFCDDTWNWSDGPGFAGGGRIDLQGVGTHEFGHSLGLGHTSVGGATMVGSTFNGNDQRAIAGDDINGLQCIYGAKLSSKVEITGASVDLQSSMVTITGLNFSASNNEVWFTHASPTTPGTEPRVIVGGVSSSGGSITVTVPSGAGDGDVHVKANFNGDSSLSNGWPVNLDGVVGADPLAITSIVPSSVESLIPGTSQTVTINGMSFTGATTLRVDGELVPGTSYTLVDPNTIVLDMPQVSSLGSIDVTVDNGTETDTAQITVTAPAFPVLQVGNGEDFNNNMIASASGVDVIMAGPVGHTHYVLFSNSNSPSTIPLVSLCLGNSFSQLDLFTFGTIGSEGYTAINVAIPSIFIVWFFQSFTLMQGQPIPTSNCQEAFITP